MVKTEYYKDLTAMNTFRMKVSAKCFVEYDSIADLVEIEFSELARPLLHIGGGSNLLFTGDFKGTVLHSAVKFIEVLPEGQSSAMSGCVAGKSSDAGQGGFDGNSREVLVSVGAGVVFDDFCAWAAKEGLWGVENLSGIPGEAGASAVQNIGAYGVEAKDVIRTVYCYDIEEEEFVHFDVSECRYGYRDSMFKNPENKGRYIVTHVVFALKRSPAPMLDYGNLRSAVLGDGNASSASADGQPADTLTVAQIRNAVIGIRNEKLPSTSAMGSAGSFFKNPVITHRHFLEVQAAARKEHGGDYSVPHYIVPLQEPGTGEDCGEMVKVPAAWLIEQCGWKGRRSGGAAVYERQPLVIVNYTGQAYPEEITGLEKRIISSVRDRFGIELHPEVEHI